MADMNTSQQPHKTKALPVGLALLSIGGTAAAITLARRSKTISLSGHPIEYKLQQHDNTTPIHILAGVPKDGESFADCLNGFLNKSKGEEDIPLFGYCIETSDPALLQKNTKALQKIAQDLSNMIQRAAKQSDSVVVYCYNETDLLAQRAQELLPSSAASKVTLLSLAASFK